MTPDLTDRELQFLTCYALCLSDKQIEAQTGLSAGSVIRYGQILRRKFRPYLNESGNFRAQFALIGVAMGLGKLPEISSQI